MYICAELYLSSLPLCIRLCTRIRVRICICTPSLPSPLCSARKREREKTPLPTSHPIQTSRKLHHTWYHPIPHPAVLDQARSISPLALGSRPLALRRRVTCRSSHSLLLRPTLLHPARNSRASYMPVCSALRCSALAALLCSACMHCRRRRCRCRYCCRFRHGTTGRKSNYTCHMPTCHHATPHPRRAAALRDTHTCMHLSARKLALVVYPILTTPILSPPYLAPISLIRHHSLSLVL
jgi:hypothetical protein